MTPYLTPIQRAALAVAAGPHGIRRWIRTELDHDPPYAAYATVDTLVRRGLLVRVGGSGVFVPVRYIPENTAQESA
jgi:hypothetical protein